MAFEELRYPYKPSMKRYIGLLLVAVMLAYFSATHALHNTRGMTIHGVIPLTVQQATMFYWFGAVFFSLGALFFAHRLVKWSQVAAPMLILGSDALTLPKSDGSTDIIFYRDIHKFTITRVEKKRMAFISHTNGREMIDQHFLPDTAAFDAVTAAINQRIAR